MKRVEYTEKEPFIRKTVWESTSNRKNNSKLPKSVNHKEQHGADNSKSNHECERSSCCQRRAGANEKTSPNRTADSDHLHMPSFQFTVESRGIVADFCGDRRVIFFRIQDLLTP